MAGDNFDDDEYVANLLKQDAKTTAKKYDFVGLGAFMPKRPTERAPRPNTQFLRHIIRQTDNHNAALLAKEEEESRARLARLSAGTSAKRSGRLTPPRADYEDTRSRKRKRDNFRKDESETHYDRRDRKGRHHHLGSRKLGKERDRDSDRRKNERKYEDSENSERDNDERNTRSSRRDRTEDRQRHHSRDDYYRKSRGQESTSHRRRRDVSSSSPMSRSRSRSPRSRRHHKSILRHDSKSRNRSSKDTKAPASSAIGQRRSPAKEYESDPLENIVGPLPPQVGPAVRSRGRGAHKANSMAMDNRFSSQYDPTIDVRANSDIEDDWGETVERFRDQQKWKQSGAERLRQAGFTEDQVKKWEKGDEKNEEDVVWAQKGAAREWDRGKVVDEDGDVDLKADWGRLK